MSNELVDPLDAEMPPLKVTCTSVDCERNLHCFLKSRGMTVEQEGGCRACGAKLVDWTRVHQRKSEDIAFTFDMLKQEMIRHFMWHIPFDDEAMRKARKQGLSQVLSGVEGRLRSSIGKAAGVWDSRQTPMQGRVVFYAQHATATCCRKCVAYWHGIPPNRALSQAELSYLVELAQAYLIERLGRDLDEESSAALVDGE